jgi:membrane peptidoglycan carboxypeptidase
MLQSVVTTGTGTTAAVEGYAMAGKTGTAQKARPLEEGGGYIDDEYIVSFVGYFANTNSKLVCITCMDNPQGADGDSPTGPLFASIMRYVANRYLIEPQDAAAAAAVAASAGGAAASAGQPGEGQGQDGADPYTADDDDDWTDPDTSADEPTYGEGADTPVYYSDTDEDNTGG